MLLYIIYLKSVRYICRFVAVTMHINDGYSFVDVLKTFEYIPKNDIKSPILSKTQSCGHLT